MSIVVPNHTLKYAPKHYFVAQDKNPPVKDTVYTLLDVEGGVEVILCLGTQNNTETDTKNIDWIFTIDGEVYTYDASAADPMQNGVVHPIPLYLNHPATLPEPIPQAGHPALGVCLDVTANAHAILKGHAIKIQYRLTDVAGTAQRIYASCLYTIKEVV